MTVPREVTWATDVGNTIKYDNDFPQIAPNSADKGIVNITNDPKPWYLILLLMAVQLFTRNTLEYFLNATSAEDDSVHCQ